MASRKRITAITSVFLALACSAEHDTGGADQMRQPHEGCEWDNIGEYYYYVDQGGNRVVCGGGVGTVTVYPDPDPVLPDDFCFFNPQICYPDPEPPDPCGGDPNCGGVGPGGGPEPEPEPEQACFVTLHSCDPFNCVDNGQCTSSQKQNSCDSLSRQTCGPKDHCKHCQDQYAACYWELAAGEPYDLFTAVCVWGFTACREPQTEQQCPLP